MKFDLSHFRKVSSDAHSTTLRHPKGHEIRIAHGALKGPMKDQLHAIPMADGGEVSDKQKKQPLPLDQKKVDSAQESMRKAFHFAQGTPEGVPEITDAQREQIMQVPPIDAQSPFGPALGDAAAKYGIGAIGNVDLASDRAKEQVAQEEGRTPASEIPNSEPQKVALQRPPLQNNSQSLQMANPVPAYQKAVGMQREGIQDEAKAIGSQGSAEKTAYDDHQKAMKTFQDTYQKVSDKMEKQLNEAAEGYKSGKIDPQHYISSMSDGQKSMTAIGLILGGISGGMLGQENPALKFLNQQMDRDIEGQRMEMDKKKNLFGFYQQEYGNAKDAAIMTKATLADKLAHDLQKAASESKDPLAQARAKQALGTIGQSVATNLAEMKNRQAMLATLKSSGASGPQIINIQVPEKERSKAFEEWGKAEAINKQQTNFRQSFDHLRGQFMNGLLSPNDTKSAKQAFVGTAQKLSEGRYNYEAAQQLADSLFPAPGDTESTVQNKAGRLDNFFDALKETPTLNGNNIKPPQMKPWAKPNPNASRKQ